MHRNLALKLYASKYRTVYRPKFKLMFNNYYYPNCGHIPVFKDIIIRAFLGSYV